MDRWWCARQSEASSHSGAWELAGGGERGERGDPFAGLTSARVAAWQLGNDDEAAAAMELDGDNARAWREGGKRSGRCSVKRWGRLLL
jgi:hypothetical protein